MIYIALVDQLLYQPLQHSFFSSTLATTLCFLGHARKSPILPLEGNSALDSAASFEVVVVYFGFGELLPGVEVLEVVEEEVVQNELCVGG